MIHDHTFAPLRFIGEALGADRCWDPVARTVRIITKDALNASKSLPIAPDRAPVRPGSPLPFRGPTSVINAFRQNAGQWLKSGEILEAALEGTRSGQAAFRIGGPVQNHGVEYTISVTALNAAQEQSDTTTVRFRVQ